MINTDKIIRDDMYITNYQICFIPNKRIEKIIKVIGEVKEEQIIKVIGEVKEEQNLYIGTTMLRVINSAKEIIDTCQLELKNIKNNHIKIIQNIGYFKYSHQIYEKLYKMCPEVEFLYLKFHQYRNWTIQNKMDKDINKKGVKYGFSILENKLIFEEEQKKLQNLLEQIIKETRKSEELLEKINSGNSIEEIKKFSKTVNGDKDVFTFNGIYNLTCATIEELKKTNKKIGKCKDSLCNKWFIIKKSGTLYCDNISPRNSKLTCRQYNSKAKRYSRKADLLSILRYEYDSVKSTYLKRKRIKDYIKYKEIIDKDYEKLKDFKNSYMVIFKGIEKLSNDNSDVKEYKEGLETFKKRTLKDIKKEYESQNN